MEDFLSNAEMYIAVALIVAVAVIVIVQYALSFLKSIGVIPDGKATIWNAAASHILAAVLMILGYAGHGDLADLLRQNPEIVLPAFMSSGFVFMLLNYLFYKAGNAAGILFNHPEDYSDIEGLLDEVLME